MTTRKSNRWKQLEEERMVSFVRAARLFLVAAMFAVVIFGGWTTETASAGLFGGWKDDAIAEVKASHFEGYEEDWPVGRILELKFEDRTWKAVESESGERFVEFRGTITPETNLNALQYWVEDIERQPGSYAAQLAGMIQQSLGKERLQNIHRQAAENGMSNQATLAVVLGAAFPNYWEVGAEAGILWRRMEDGFWMLDTMASPGWQNLEFNNIVPAIMYQ